MKIIKGIFSYHGKSREAIFSLVVNLKQSCSVKWPYSQSFVTGKFLIDGNVQPEEQKRGDRAGSIFPQTLSLDFRLLCNPFRHNAILCRRSTKRACEIIKQQKITGSDIRVLYVLSSSTN